MGLSVATLVVGCEAPEQPRDGYEKPAAIERPPDGDRVAIEGEGGVGDEDLAHSGDGRGVCHSSAASRRCYYLLSTCTHHVLKNHFLNWLRLAISRFASRASISKEVATKRFAPA